MFTKLIYLSSQRLLHQKNVSLKKSRDFFKKSLTRFYKERIIKKKLRHFVHRKKSKNLGGPKLVFWYIFSPGNRIRL